MTAGRRPIRPYPDHKPSAVSGLGSEERTLDETQDVIEFHCGMYNNQDAIFGVGDNAGEEF